MNLLWQLLLLFRRSAPTVPTQPTGVTLIGTFSLVDASVHFASIEVPVTFAGIDVPVRLLPQ